MPDFNIHDRIYKLVLNVLLTTRKIYKTPENIIIINQLMRSITSVGANDQEADGVNSKADFTHCYTLVRKETKESIFWLSLLGDLNPRVKPETQSHINEAKEIVKIVSAIINKTKTN